jgi:hypothetical protein
MLIKVRQKAVMGEFMAKNIGVMVWGIKNISYFCPAKMMAR